MWRRIAACWMFVSLAAGAVPQTAGAGQGWYAGDICSYPARNTATVISETVQQGMDAGLDWLVFYGNSREGMFTGLRDILQEYDLNTPRITPIMGTGWALQEGMKNDLILFGVDPRAPVPRDSLQQAILWAESHGGVSIYVRPGQIQIPAPSPPQWQTATAFLGLRGGVWSPACEPGGVWDRMLTGGRRVFLVGSSDGTAGGGPGRAQKIYVWAENAQPEGIIAGIRRGAAYVAEADGIRMDFQVNGRSLGSTVPVSQDAYVRLQAAARYPISRVDLIADGETVWSAWPDTTIWEARFFLPLINRNYVRAVLESDAGGCRTLGNPIFLVTDAGDTGGEIPIEEPHRPFSEAYLDVDGALETSARLPPDPQRAILSELLRNVRMRYVTAWALQNREDLISTALLNQLLRHTDREVRLGAAYALAVRVPADLPAMALRLLRDDDPRVREYAARMLRQYTEGVDNSQVARFLDDPQPAVRMYLIRAVNASRFDPILTGKLIAASRSPHPGVASAALDKLSEMGTVNFRVIQALIDSGRAGNPHALEVIGWIGEHRAIPDLEDIYRSVPYGAVKRASFLALAKMGAPYDDKRQTTCAWMPEPPRVDGRLEPDEWQSAVPVRGFTKDWDGTPAGREIIARIARDSTRFYLAFTSGVPDSLVPTASVELRDADIRHDDRVEWAFCPSGDADDLRVFAVTSLGVVQDRKGADLNWNPHWEAVSLRQPGRWTLESAIPLSAVGLEPDRLAAAVRFNLSFVEGGPSAQRWTWSVTYGSPGDPDRYGRLAFEGLPGGEVKIEPVTRRKHGTPGTRTGDETPAGAHKE